MAISEKKRVDCFFFLHDGCLKGDACEFRHSPAAQQNTINCKYWPECAKDDCPFRHPQQRDRARVACFYLDKPGGCTKGQACPYSHDANTHTNGDLEAESTPTKQSSPPPKKPKKLETKGISFVKSLVQLQKQAESEDSKPTKQHQIEQPATPQSNRSPQSAQQSQPAQPSTTQPSTSPQSNQFQSKNKRPSIVQPNNSPPTLQPAQPSSLPSRKLRIELPPKKIAGKKQPMRDPALLAASKPNFGVKPLKALLSAPASPSSPASSKRPAEQPSFPPKRARIDPPSSSPASSAGVIAFDSPEPPSLAPIVEEDLDKEIAEFEEEIGELAPDDDVDYEDLDIDILD